MKSRMTNFFYLKKLSTSIKDDFNKTSNGIRSAKWNIMLHQLLVSHYVFYLCFLVLILIFLITRLPFFIHYPIVGIGPDTENYVQQASLIKSGNLPSFEQRPPGYIFFVWLVTSIIDRWIVVAGVQSLLFLIANLYLIYGVYALHRPLVLPATLAMAGFLGSSHILIYETAALSESLYTTCLIFIFAFLLLGFGRYQKRYFIMSSLFMGILISIRFAGMFILVVYFAILLYMFWNKYKPKYILGFLSPLLLLLFFWSAYNYFTLGKFNFILTSAYNTGGATVWFWEPDQSFSPAVNEVLRELPADLKGVGVTKADQRILKTSWNPEQLMPIFYKSYAPLVVNGWTHTRFDNINGESAESIVKTLIVTTIKKHPNLYAKFVWTNLYFFYKTLEWGKIDFYAVLKNRTTYLYTGEHAGKHDNLYHNPDLNGKVSKEYYNKYTLDFASVDHDMVITLTDTPLKRLHSTLQPIQGVLFHQSFWIITFFIVFGMSTLQLLVTKGTHFGAFILFVMTIIVIGASLITCLSEVALERYAYPTQFIYYLSVALAPLLWVKNKD